MRKLIKPGNTPFEFNKINVDLDKNTFLPKISSLNELRRKALEEVENYALSEIKRTMNVKNSVTKNNSSNYAVDLKSKKSNRHSHNTGISLLLNVLNLDFDYLKLENVDKLYIPLKYFSNKKYFKILNTLNSKFNLYIYLPNIIKANYRNMFHNNIENAINTYNIKGFVLSNISNFVLLKDLCNKFPNKFELIANYTLNIYNDKTINELGNLGISIYTVSPELDKKAILDLTNNNYQQELIVYGKIPLMNINYCLLGKTNKCFPQCDAQCLNKNNHYYLKDRLNMQFDVLPDNIQTITTIYNSKILSILPSNFNLDFARIDILYEDIDEINNIINTVKSNNRFEGKEFTNGNLNRKI